MAVQFPTNPQEGDQFISGSYIFIFTDDRWTSSVISGTLNYIVGATGPQGDATIGATGPLSVANFVASGTIPNGATVVINTDGTVSIVTDNPSSNLTAENYIGIAAEAISNGSTGNIDIVGGVNSGQSGLIVGKKYYVQLDGSLAITPADPVVVAGTSVGTTKIIVKG